MADLTIFTGIYSPDIVAMLVGGLLLTGAIAGLLAG